MRRWKLSEQNLENFTMRGRFWQKNAKFLHKISTSVQVTVFSVGVTSGVNEVELTTIASEPKCSHVYLLESFTDIASFSSLILKGACDGQFDWHFVYTAHHRVTKRDCCILPSIILKRPNHFARFLIRFGAPFCLGWQRTEDGQKQCELIQTF